MKISYKNSVMKREVQSYIYDRVQNPNIKGLGGPNAKDYERILKEKGFRNITLYENNKDVFEALLKDPPYCKLEYDDILNHLKTKSFYDLDFCCSVLSVRDYLPEIAKIPQYSMTLSLRPIGIQRTLDIVKEYEKRFTYVIYKDTSPMIVIYKI